MISASKFKRLYKNYGPEWQTLLSAALIVFSFPPWNFYFLIWICLIPWFNTLYRLHNLAHSLKKAFLQGIWLSFFMSLGGFYWVASVLHEFGALPWSLSIVGLLFFNFFCQPQFPVFALIFVWIRKNISHEKNHFLTALLLAFAYTGIDWVIPKLFMDTLGHSLHQAKWLRQLADLGGASLLTFLIYLVNDTIWVLWTRLKNRKEPSTWPAIQATSSQILLTLGLMAFAFIYGGTRLQSIREQMRNSKTNIQLAVIQANIGDFDKIAAESGVRDAAQKVLKAFFDLSDQALAMKPKPEALIWPETSYPTTFRSPHTSAEFALDRKLEDYVKSRKTTLLFGGYDHFNNKDHNAFFFLMPTAGEPGSTVDGDLQVYRKSILLLFGEYIPGAETFPFLKQAFPQVGNFGRGPGPEVFHINHKVITNPVICYEALFSNYILEAARKGSQLIMNITNDSWFGPWGEPHLHFALSKFRSIESRLPQIRSTNTGISALILPDGDVPVQSGIDTQEILNITVPITDSIPTLMKSWGDWFGLLAFTVGMIGILGLGFSKKNK